mgnify:CR=1 FL=1
MLVLMNRDDEYQNMSLPESDFEDDSRKRITPSVSFRGHPWSDDDDESDSYISNRIKKPRVKTEALNLSIRDEALAVAVKTIPPKTSCPWRVQKKRKKKKFIVTSISLLQYLLLIVGVKSNEL